MPYKHLFLIMTLSLGVYGLCPEGHQFDSLERSCVPIARYLSGAGSMNQGCPMCNLKPIVDKYESFNRVKQVPPRNQREQNPKFLLDIFDLPRYAAEIAKKSEGERKEILSGLLHGLDWTRLPIIEVNKKKR